MEQEIIRFIIANFQEGNIVVQLKNCKRLVSFLKKKKYELDIDSATNLLYESKELNKMAMMISQMNSDELESEENISTIMSAYKLINRKNDRISKKDTAQKTNSYETVNISAFDNMDLYLKDLAEIAEINRLTHEEEIKLGKKVLSGDLDAKQKLIESNLPVVIYVAKKYAKNAGSLSMLDLIQEGNIGLMQAVESYDYRVGARFITHAVWWIRQAITRGIADKSRMVRLPVYLFEDVKRINKLIRDYQEQYGFEPTDETISDILFIPVEKVRRLKVEMQEPLSFSQPLSKSRNNIESNGELGEFVADSNSEIYNFENESFYSSFNSVIFNSDILTEREKYIIKHRFGFEGEKHETLEDIGKTLGLTRERVRQLEKGALKVLRNSEEIKCFNQDREQQLIFRHN